MAKIVIHVHYLICIFGSSHRSCHFHFLYADLLSIPIPSAVWTVPLKCGYHWANFDLWVLLFDNRRDDPSLGPWLRMKIGWCPYMNLKWSSVVNRLGTRVNILLLLRLLRILLEDIVELDVLYIY
jgi:hypothetical protein